MSNERAVAIDGLGVFTERFPDLGSLRERLTAGDGAPAEAARRTEELFAPVRVQPKQAGLLEREDRATLNDVSTLVVNAVDDAVAGLPVAPAEGAFADSPVFVGSDSAEHNFGALSSLVREDQAGGSVYSRLGLLRQRANPMEMLRCLSTNAAFHASKRLRSQGGAYPLRAASLSGLVALEEAALSLEAGGPDQATVIGAGNMRGFDSLVTFTKLGLISDGGGREGVLPSYGAVCLLLSRGDGRGASYGKVLAAKSFYAPDVQGRLQSWKRLFQDALKECGRPDVVVTYASGAPALDHAERSALEEILPGVATRNYKGVFGYTGKANNLLDLAAALVDPTVAAEAKILIAGAGLGYGVGYIVVEKGSQANG